MPLDGTRLGTGSASFKTAYKNHIARITPSDPSQPISQADIDISLEQFYEELGHNVVGEFTGNAIVPVGIAVQVTPSSGTGATNGTGTLT